MSAFEQVGKLVEFGTAEISLDDALDLRRHALTKIPIKSIELDDYHTKITAGAYATGDLSDSAGDYNVTHEQVMATYRYTTHPNAWQTRITFAKSRNSSRETKIFTSYYMEGVGDELLLAKKRVNVLRALSRVVIDDDEPTTETYSRQRKMFEQPMTEDDIESASRKIGAIIIRASHGK